MHWSNHQDSNIIPSLSIPAHYYLYILTVISAAATLPDAPFLAVNRMDTIGIYTPEERKRRIERFWEKRRSRVWTKKVKYDVRKNFADSRIRVKGRFVKKEDEISILSSSVSQFAQSSSAIKTLNGN